MGVFFTPVRANTSSSSNESISINRSSREGRDSSERHSGQSTRLPRKSISEIRNSARKRDSH